MFSLGFTVVKIIMHCAPQQKKIPKRYFTNKCRKKTFYKTRGKRNLQDTVCSFYCIDKIRQNIFGNIRKVFGNLLKILGNCQRFLESASFTRALTVCKAFPEFFGILFFEKSSQIC